MDVLTVDASLLPGIKKPTSRAGFAIGSAVILSTRIERPYESPNLCRPQLAARDAAGISN
jgi:hypothetical protein